MLPKRRLRRRPRVPTALLEPQRCQLCGSIIESIPFPLDNVICKQCYGLDRYRRQNGPGAASDASVGDLDEAA